MYYGPMDEQLPVFVYGTLRPGEANWRRLQPYAARTQRAQLAGYALFGAQWPYPYAAPSADAAVVGDLVQIRQDDYADALHVLDSLEGYQSGRAHNHYDRVAVTVQTDAGEDRTAWVYVAGVGCRHLTAEQRIATGDWLSRDTARCV